MNNSFRHIICLTLLSFLICISIIGCSFFSPIIGKWQDTKTKDTVEFTRGGDVIIKSSGLTITGSYELVGSDVVKLNLEGIGAWATLFGADNWEYNISGDTMTIIAAGTTSKFIRVSK